MDPGHRHGAARGRRQPARTDVADPGPAAQHRRAEVSARGSSRPSSPASPRRPPREVRQRTRLRPTGSSSSRTSPSTTRSRRWITLRHWGSRTSTCRRSCRRRSAPSTATTSPTTRRSPRGSAATPAFARLVEAAHAAGLGVVVDVVPNHMTTPTPLSLNRPLWSVLREGRQSAYATWFDVDWDAQDGRILMPVLGAPLDEVLAAGEISVGEHEGEPVVRYYDHVFPLAAGHRPAECRWVTSSTPSTTASRPGRSATPSSTTGASSTSPRSSRCASRSPRSSTRRTRCSSTASAPAPSTVCASTTPTASPTPRATSSGSPRRPVTRGSSSRRSSRASEQLPHGVADGRDDRLRRPAAHRRALRRPGRRAAARRPLDGAARRATGPRGDRHGVEAVGRAGHARHRGEPAACGSSRGRGPTSTPTRRARCIEAMLVGMDRYRVYLRPGHAPRGARRRRARGRPCRAARRARAVRCDREAVDVVVDLALGQASPVDQDGGRRVRRAVPADVRARHGQGDRGHGVLPLRAARRAQRGGRRSHPGGRADPGRSTSSRRTCSGAWPQSMTTLSTHDTKRAEDVRARLFVLAERPDAWATWVRTARELAATGARRGARRAHRVLPVADPRRRVADQRGPAAGLRPQGDSRVEALHAVDRARRGLRVGRRALRLRQS